MTTTATARLTIGAVFGSIAQTAGTVSNVLGAANSSVNMLNAYVEKAAKEQRMNYRADEKELANKIIERVSKEQVERRIELDKFCAQSDRHEKLYQEALEEYKDMFKDM